MSATVMSAGFPVHRRGLERGGEAAAMLIGIVEPSLGDRLEFRGERFDFL